MISFDLLRATFDVTGQETNLCPCRNPPTSTVARNTSNESFPDPRPTCYRNRSRKGAAMDLSYTPEHEAVRKKVRAWLKDNLPKKERTNQSVEYETERIAEAKDWQRKLPKVEAQLAPIL